MIAGVLLLAVGFVTFDYWRWIFKLFIVGIVTRRARRVRYVILSMENTAIPGIFLESRPIRLRAACVGRCRRP